MLFFFPLFLFFYAVNENQKLIIGFLIIWCEWCKDYWYVRLIYCNILQLSTNVTTNIQTNRISEQCVCVQLYKRVCAQDNTYPVQTIVNEL